MVLVLIGLKDSDLNSKFSADGYTGSAICLINLMVGYGG